jgi:hypothetical protein
MILNIRHSGSKKPLKVHVLDKDPVEATVNHLGILLDFKNPRLLKQGILLPLDNKTLSEAGVVDGDTLEIEEAV